MVAIKIENLSKKYIIGHDNSLPYSTFRDTLADFGNKFNPVNWFKEQNQNSKEEFWALKDINLEIKQGEKIGIIGRNGAGKSTLLKILSRITEPTTGSVKIKGRVASLLEVGTGFHPELSGRENIFLNGAILGMRKQEIKSKFDEIVDFSGVEKFLDTPVKRYSSGMYVRLAFAVAAHLEPEILLIDEVLAVGDAEFQKKCLGKMDDVAKQGRTVIFVSHNMAAVRQLCERGVLVEKGEVKYSGLTDTIVSQYISNNNRTAKESFVKHPNIEFDLLIFANNKEKDIKTGDDITFSFTFASKKKRERFQIGIGILNTKGERVTTIHSSYQTLQPYTLFEGKNIFKAVWKKNMLCPGNYGIELSLFDANSNFAHFGSVGLIQIIENDFYGTGKMPNTRYQGDLLTEVEWYSL
ncbi:MAG: ATP-binding cassette domain-containing protein [Candidatus Delongbacteria bacterium]|nr:ATP-binding cassette domain-containing protein [Candidatus Delongbacteria bacterium]